MRLQIPKDAKNLRVIRTQDTKKLSHGMNALAEGLGVKCNACHVKGDYASDEKEAKRVARIFLRESIARRRPATGTHALYDLLSAVGQTEIDDPEELGEAVALWSGDD